MARRAKRKTLASVTEVFQMVLQVLILAYHSFIQFSLRIVKVKLLSNRQSLTKYLNYCSNEIGTPTGQIGRFTHEGNAKPKIVLLLSEQLLGDKKRL